MSKYRASLPQLGEKLFLTDGGLETTLVFHDGLDLPFFAACDLLRTAHGRKRLADYYERYIAIAADVGYGFILEAPTWRASADWGLKLGYSPEEFAYSLRLIAEGQVDAASMVTASVGIDGVAKAFADLANPEVHTKIIVEPWR